MRLELDCASGCPNGSWTVKVEDSKDITMERVHLHARAGTPGQAAISNPIALGIGGGGLTVERMTVYQSNIHTSGYGINARHCDDCWFSGNWLGPITDGRQAYALANKSQGSGVRFTNNTFDMGGDLAVGIYLRSEPTDTVVNSSVQLIGNSFIHMQDDIIGNQPQKAIHVYRYNRANIQGNTFSCASGDTSCPAVGIEFLGSTPPDTVVCPTGLSCNRENLIADNVFEHLQDNDSAICPIRFRNGLNANTDNIVRGNIFRLGTASVLGADGVCDFKSSTTLNPQHENHVFGP